MTLLFAALALGAVGSGHCLVMCGPLLVALERSAATQHPTGRLARALLYHGGRVGMYALVGALAGQAGYELASGGFGRPLAIVAGASLAAIAIGRLTRNVRPTFRGREHVATALTLALASGAARVCGIINRWSRSHPIAGTLGAGMANALLPCGLVYAAIAAAAAVGNAAHAALFMTAFGLGTVPALIALAFTANRAPRGLQMALQKTAPVVLLVLAALLIMRGVAPVAAAASACAHGHGVALH